MAVHCVSTDSSMAISASRAVCSQASSAPFEWVPAKRQELSEAQLAPELVAGGGNGEESEFHGVLN
eukprot:13656539-Alexandrium_andersonii.AAC.1